MSRLIKKSILLVLVLLTLLAASPALASGGEYSSSQWKDLGLRFMNFAVFLAILWYFAKKPIFKFFRERRENIAQNLEYLETQARNLEEQTEIMNKQIAGIAAERDAILAQYERMGQKEADRIISEAKISAEAIINRTEAAMEKEILNARQTLLNDIVKLATTTATELVKSNITKDDQQRLTYEFKEQVEKLQKAS